MSSIVDISRDALQIISAKSIVSLDENTNSARQCKEAYPKARDFVLRSYPWSCAVRRVALPSSAKSLAYGDNWNCYLRPVDDIMLLPLTSDGEENGAPVAYRLEGRYILTTLEAPLKYRYITNNIDPVEMPPDLRRAIAARMAAYLAEVLTGSQTILNNALAIYSREVAEAKAGDTGESFENEIAESSWVEARL